MYISNGVTTNHLGPLLHIEHGTSNMDRCGNLKLQVHSQTSTVASVEVWYWLVIQPYTLQTSVPNGHQDSGFAGYWNEKLKKKTISEIILKVCWVIQQYLRTSSICVMVSVAVAALINCEHKHIGPRWLSKNIQRSTTYYGAARDDIVRRYKVIRHRGDQSKYTHLADLGSAEPDKMYSMSYAHSIQMAVVTLILLLRIDLIMV